MPKIINVEFKDGYYFFVLDDGRKVGEPISKYYRLSHATEAQLLNFVISEEGVHWPDIDEDLALAPLLS